MKFDSYLSRLCHFTCSEKSRIIDTSRMRDDSRTIAFFSSSNRYGNACIFAVKKIVLRQRKGTGRETFYEYNAASLVSSTVDIGDCRVCIAGYEESSIPYGIYDNGVPEQAAASRKQRTRLGECTSSASIRLSPSFGVILSMAAFTSHRLRIDCRGWYRVYLLRLRLNKQPTDRTPGPYFYTIYS